MRVALRIGLRLWVKFWCHFGGGSDPHGPRWLRHWQ